MEWGQYMLQLGRCVRARLRANMKPPDNVDIYIRLQPNPAAAEAPFISY